VVQHLRDPIDDLAAFYYETGWRREEVLGLRWAWVERGRRIVLPDSKNDEGRVVPLEGRLAELVEKRWSKREYRRADGTTALAEYVFHRAGKPVRSFDKQWASACTKAGVHRLVHDFRRTVARDGVEAGNDVFAVMALTGHRSLTTFRRYNIIDTRRVAAAMKRTEAYRAGRLADTARTVTALGTVGG
jgi:integrase